MIALNAISPIKLQHPLNHGLRAWFLAGVLGRTGGAAWFDLVQSHRGVLSFMDPPTDWIGADRFGAYGALDLDGINDQVNLPTSFSVAGLSEATVSCWYKPQLAATSTRSLFYESTGTAGFARFSLTHHTGNILRGDFRDSETSAAFTAADTVTLTLERWYFAAVTLNSTTDRLVLYRDGEQVAINTTAKGPFTATAPALVQLGRYGVSDRINGQIDDVRIWHRELSAAEIRRYYDLTRRGYAPLINVVEPFAASAITAVTFSAGWAGGSNVILGGGVP